MDLDDEVHLFTSAIFEVEGYDPSPTGPIYLAWVTCLDALAERHGLPPVIRGELNGALRIASRQEVARLCTGGVPEDEIRTAMALLKP